MELTLERLREILSYDPETGIFTWKVKTGSRALKGAVAGHICAINRYHYVKIDRRRYPSHRLAWFYMTGAWPSDQIDHIDRDFANNAFSNLREASNAENCQNRRVRRDNTSGVTGVMWVERLGKFTVAVGANGKRRHIGVYAAFDDAVEARNRAAADAHGEFFRTA